MNFFERQRLARAASRRLIVLFGLAVVGIVVAVCAIVSAFLLIGAADQRRGASFTQVMQEHAGLLMIVALVTVAVIAVTSLVRASQLRQGGGAIARQLGGTLLPTESRDLKHQRLRNVVEEVAIASGVPVPEIYVLEHEAGINAFAAGFSTADAAIAVTRGTLELLNRDELQGVIAHEFSHVLNGDMRLNLRLIGWLAGITLLGLIGRILMRVRGRNAGGIVMMGVGLAVIGAIGLIAARMIKAGISRRREYLADASAVQFTRQTSGIAGALKQIAGSAHGSKLTSTDGEEVSHLLFGDGVGYSRLFATHPPLPQRIAALEPGFTMEQLPAWLERRRRRGDSESSSATASARSDRGRFGFPDVLDQAGDAIPAPVIIAGLPAGVAGMVRPQQVIDQVAAPASDDYRTAELLHDYLPEGLDEVAHQPEQAPALLLAVLLSAGDADDGALLLIDHEYGADFGAQVRALIPSCRSLHPMQRLPLAQITFAAVRRLPADRVTRLRDLVGRVISSDGEVSLFEYCLGFLLRQQIDETLNPQARPARQRHELAGSQAEVGVLLSMLAQAGQVDGPMARRAFAAGIGELGSAITPAFVPLSARWQAALDAAFPVLDDLTPTSKELLIAAMTRAVMHDNRLDVAESELLRTACAALHCPLPPLLHEGDATVEQRPP